MWVLYIYMAGSQCQDHYYMEDLGCLNPGQQEEGRWEWLTTGLLKKRTSREC